VEGGVLILADIDPTNVSVSGTTRGVEAGQAVTVTLLDEEGATFFTDDSATVAADGTWSLDLPSSTVEDLEAGQTYDVQADVSNAVGRDAPQAQSQVVAYAPAANFAVETTRTGGDIGLEIQTDMSVATGSVLNSVEFTTSFDPNLASLDLSAFNIPNALTTTTIQPNAFNLTELGGLNTNDGSFSFGGNSLAGFDNLDTEPLFGFGVSGVDQNEVLGIRVSADAGANSITSADQLTVAGQPTPQSFEDAFGPSTSYLGTAGGDNIVANDADTLIRGRGGDDAIDLSGTGVNTVLFEADATANGFDTVTDFSIGGPLPDRLGFAGLNNEDLRGDGGTFELLSGTDSVGANTGLIVFTTKLDDFEAGSVQSALDGLTDLADGDMLYFLASDGTDAQLYEVQVQAGDDTVTDMARFEGLGDLNGITEANILGFDTTGTPV